MTLSLERNNFSFAFFAHKHGKVVEIVELLSKHVRLHGVNKRAQPVGEVFTLRIGLALLPLVNIIIGVARQQAYGVDL